MKNLMKKTAVVFAASLLFVACEKDETSVPISNSSEKIAKKNKSTNSKSGSSVTYQELKTYDSLLVIGSSPSTEERDHAIRLIESSINVNYGTLGRVSTFSEIADFELEIYSSPTSPGADHEVSGSEALSYYNDLEVAVEEAFENSNLYALHGVDAFISVIDIQFDENIIGVGGNTSANGEIIIKYHPEPVYPFCSSENSWKALDLLGLCSTPESLDAAKRLESFLTNQNCNGSLLPGLCTHNRSYAIKLRSKDGFLTSNIWDGTAPSNCISASALNNTYFPGMITEGNSMVPPSTPNLDYNVVDYAVGKALKPSPISDVAHDLVVGYSVLFCPNI